MNENFKYRKSEELGGVSEVCTSIDGLISQLFFDSENLVVLGESVRSARSSTLDLTSSKTNDKITNEVVLSFSGSVGDHDSPSSCL